MSVITDSRPWPGNTGKYLYYYYNDSTPSSRGPDGKLLLVEHLHDFQEQRVTNHSSTLGTLNLCQGAETATKYPFLTSDTNELYARLMGKLNNGSASLGMTLASMNQAMDMIVNKFDDINHIMKQALGRHRFVRNVKRRRGANRKLLASEVLEVEFGWKPFINDIFSAMTILTSPKNELIRIKARIRPNPYRSATIEGEPRITTEWAGSAIGTATACYAVTNPNLWLANRLGLINPVAVAWDKVPWSWVVNMFVNTNQLISSLSDTVGLDLINGSMTLSSKVMRTQTKTYRFQPNVGVSSTCTVLGRHRSRTGLSSLRPGLEFKLPKFNLELGIIASALAVQRSKSLG